MKILLVQPPVTRDPGEEQKHRTPLLPPLGLLYIAAILERDTDHGVRVYDALAKSEGSLVPLEDGRVRYGATDAQIADVVRREHPDVVGVTCMFSNNFRDLHNVLRIVKDVDARIVTVAGGPHATVWADGVLKDKNVDLVVRHEGEIAFPMVLQGLDGDVAFKDIPNLSWHREENGFLRHEHNPVSFIPDLDVLPFPARHLVDPPAFYSKIQSPHGSHFTGGTVLATMVASRGCPYHCAFCSAPIVMGQSMRYRSPGNFCDEVQLLKEKYGVRQISIEDDDFNAVKPKFKAMLKELIARDLDVEWHAPNGLLAAGIDEEAAELMYKSGCKSVSLGLESGNERVLHKLIHKPVTLDHVPKAVRWLKEWNIRVMLFLIIGTPGETKEEVLDTWAYARECRADWYGVHIFTPLPGTEAWKECLEKGYISADIDFSRLKYSIGNVRTPWLDPEWLEAAQHAMNLSLNFFWNSNVPLNWQRAHEDFQRVLGLYPDLPWAMLMERETRSK